MASLSWWAALEIEVLFLLANSKDGASFVEIEDILSHNTDGPSVRIKKREKIMRHVNEKLAALFNHSVEDREDYILSLSNTLDKRSKRLVVNTKFFKVM